MFGLTVENRNDMVYTGLARVKSDSGWGLIDKKGEIIVPCKYRSVQPERANGRIVYKLMTYGGMEGLVDADGRLLVPPVYKEVQESDGRYMVVRGRNYKLGVYDTENKKEIIPARWDSIDLGNYIPVNYKQSIRKPVGKNLRVNCLIS